MTVLNILMQNPNATFEDVVGSAVTLKHEDAPGEGDDAPLEAQNAPTQGPKYRIEDIEF
jgi:hypothetical protein